MRAGRLDRHIHIERATPGAPNAAGTATLAWSPLACVRAEIIQGSAQEFIRGGAVDEAAIVFRIRWVCEVKLADRVVYEGEAFNIKELKEIGRRRGLEIRCQRIGGSG